MPIYEYACEGCGEEFEKLSLGPSSGNGNGGGGEIHCPSCDSASVSKQFSTFGMKTGYVPIAAPAGGKAPGGGCCGGFCGCG